MTNGEQSLQLPSSVRDQMRANGLRTGYLFLIFPVLILGLTYAGILISMLFSSDAGTQFSPLQAANEMMRTVGFWVIVAVFLYSLFSFFLGSKLLLAFAGAKPLEKRANPQLYRIVENLSIAAGLPKTPDIYVIEDMSMNAFATGFSPADAKVAISTGLLERLSKQEVEAVMAHEIAHILNRDTRVMLLAVTLVGAIEMIGEILIRTRWSSDDNKGNPLFFVGLLFITLGVLAGILNKLAISREREYLADATGGFLCSNPLALATALEKIAGDARLEVLDGKSSMSGLCIADPTESGHFNHGMALKNGLKEEGKRGGLVAFWQKIWSTHPPIDDRISKLRQY